MSEYAKRVVALLRQNAGYRSMVKRGDLLQGEADALVAANNAEIARMRSQGELPLSVQKPAVGAEGAESGQDSKEGGKPVQKGR